MDTTLAQTLMRPAVIRVLIVFTVAGAALYLGALVWSGWAEALIIFARIGGWTITAGAVVASSAFLLRFARWQFSLQRLGHVLPTGYNLRVYLAGLALTTSPGKLGETLRSLLLLTRGVPASHSLGAFLADRLADVLGLCTLAVISALLAGRDAATVLAGGLLLLLAALMVRGATSHSGFGALLERVLMRLPAIARLGVGALRSWADLWSPLRAVMFSLVAVAAYGLQALVFWWFCRTAGLELSASAAVAIFAWATLFGAASMIPGGLGTMEAALVLQLAAGGATEATAIAVAIAARMVTLWLGVSIGVAALASVAWVAPASTGSMERKE